MSLDGSSKNYREKITVGFPEVLHDQFERICLEKGFRKDEVIRTLVDDFVEKYLPDDEPSENEASQDPDQMEAFAVEE
jgi:metal-responsive CopG/Arc/MetJ family transcriptional regulator